MNADLRHIAPAPGQSSSRIHDRSAAELPNQRAVPKNRLGPRKHRGVTVSLATYVTESANRQRKTVNFKLPSNRLTY